LGASTARENRVFDRARRYRGAALREIAFPLGGIGTGCVSLTGVGGLAEWQIRNRPDTDSINEHTFFSIWAKRQGERPVAKVLEGPVPERKLFGDPYTGNGSSASSYGFPRFEEAEFLARFPFATVALKDDDIPLDTIGPVKGFCKQQILFFVSLRQIFISRCQGV